ncbi:protein FAM193A-like isoform X2 [Lytechinus variegatus]|uniref:protein FAM193A-like isoform X2 n=1 Tax=Lytechinus variegatus TaxID=7654 RepID=UPI001BB1A98D|nr:protein FAM193A-like isoform X2 [Lytechinus variegatus]
MHHILPACRTLPLEYMPMSQMPRSHNPYLDREHCLLCRRERPDPPANRIPPGVGSEKENNRQLPITQMPLWLCPDCRRTVEEEEANSTKNFDPSAIGELLLPSTLPLITGLDGAFSSSSSVGGDTSSVVTSTSGGKGGSGGGDGRGGGGDGPCQCEPCRERREIAAEQEHSRQQLGECWTELSHLVRCVYWEAGTSLTGEESTTKLSLPRMKELVRRLCAHDPHLLYMRLEVEVEDFIKEMRERLLKQLDGGFRTPPLAKQFITMLLEEYAALCSAAQTLLAILEELEKEHLHKFNLTWPLHNKHLFHSLIYMEPGLHDNLGTLIKQLRTVASQKEPYHEDCYSNLLQRYLQFDNDMSVIAVVWRDCQQLIEDYTDEQELYKGKEALNRSWDTGVTTTRPRPLSCEANKTSNSRNLYQCHSALINHMANGSGTQENNTTNHRGSTKKKCLCDDCSLNRLTSSLLTPDLYEEIGLKHLSEAAPGGQLSALDTYLQSINPPDLSSTTSSSDCSSQGDSEEVIPIFSRSDLIHSGFCSPRSDDSDDSDDLDSESSPSPSHENAFEDEDDDGEGRQNENSSSRGRTRCRASYSGGDRQSNGGDVKKDSNVSSNQPCECHVCSANNGTHLSTSAMMAGDNKPSYLFYPNLQSHQPLDLSHPGISAKHPLIHPHLYNLTSQKPNKIPNHSQQAFQLSLDASDGLQNYGDWNSAYESAKMVLHTHSHAHFGHEEAPDLIQSAKAAIQSNCRAEKSENRSAKIVPVHQGQHNSEGKATKEEKGKKHNHDGSGVISNGISEWTKQQRLAQHLHSEKGKNSSLVAQELCAKHNFPAVPKLPNNVLISPTLLQGTDATSGTMTQESLAQQFSSGVLTQQALMTQGMLAAQGTSLQLQNAGIHVADVHHLQQQQQQHAAPSDGKKKKKNQGGVEDSLPAEPTVRLPDYLNEQHLHTCSHQNQISHSSSVLGTNAGLCSSSMQTTPSTPNSASVCSSEPDYETPNYQHDEDTPSNYDDKDSNASSTTRERESKHCECCYCEFFGQGPQPAPTSRNYTEIRDRLRLRLRERKQPKDQSPTHEPPTPHPPNDLLHADERKVEDLLSFIEGAKKTKSSSKAAKRQRQRQKKAEQKSKSVPDNGHKKDIPVPVSLHHHHHHHHHHHVEVSREKQHEATSQHNTNCTAKPSHPIKQLHQAPAKQQSQSQETQSESKSVPASKGHPRPQLDQRTRVVASQPLCMSMTGSSPSAESSTQASANSRAVPMVTSQESVPKGESNSTSKKGKGSGVTQPQVQAIAPSSNSGNKNLENKAKGKQNGAGKQGPSLAHHPSEASVDGRGKTDQETGKSLNKRDHVVSNKTGSQSSQQRIVQNQKHQQQQKTDKTPRHDNTNAWKTSSMGGQERLLNGNASDSCSGISSRCNSVGSKINNSRTKQGGAPSTNIDDPHLKKQTNLKPSHGTPMSAATAQGNPKATTTINTKKANQTSNSIKERLPQKMEETATARLASKRSETNHKMDTRTSQNGGGHDQMTNGLALSNGSSTTNKRRKKKKNSDNPNASIDEIFLPKENIDMNEMDETERELEAFKRFCMASTPQQHKEKVVFNVKDLALKKSSLQAH